MALLRALYNWFAFEWALALGTPQRFYRRYLHPFHTVLPLAQARIRTRRG